MRKVQYQVGEKHRSSNLNKSDGKRDPETRNLQRRKSRSSGSHNWKQRCKDRKYIPLTFGKFKDLRRRSLRSSIRWAADVAAVGGGEGEREARRSPRAAVARRGATATVVAEGMVVEISIWILRQMERWMGLRVFESRRKLLNGFTGGRKVCEQFSI